MKQTNIVCSRICQDFIILYDGQGTYYLYYENELINEIIEPETPVKIHEKNNLNIPYREFKEKNDKDFLNQIMQEIININGDAPKIQYKLMTILKDLIRTLKDAEKDTQYNMEFFGNAPSVVIEKARELTTLAGYETTIFDDLITPIDIDAEIQAREKPILTNEEKAKADAIAKIIKDKGLLKYLKDILDKIHIGKHKNIYRKILVLFKIMRGEGSFISETTAKAEQGKSFEDDIILKYITPSRYVLDVNQITEASFIRKCFNNSNYYDRLILNFADLGAKKSFDKVAPILNIVKPLITEGKYTYIKSKTDDDIGVLEIPINVNSIGVWYQTTKNSFTEDDDQLISRTIYSTPTKAVKKDIAKQIFYQKNPLSKQSKARKEAEQDLRDFGLYLMDMVNNEDKILNPYFDEFWDYANKSENPIREFNQQLELFDAYCKLTIDKCKKEPYNTLFASEEQLKEYMDYINLENALIPYEYDFLDMLLATGTAKELTILYNENDFYDAEGIQLNYDAIGKIDINEVYDAEGNKLDIDLDNIITLRECENNAIEILGMDTDRDIETYSDLTEKDLKAIPYKLNANYGFRSQNAEKIIFFRFNDLKSYYKRRRAYKNIENVPQLLQTLHNKGYLGKYEYKIGKENLYYLTPMCNNLTSDFKMKKSYDRYVSDYILNTGLQNY